jgi:hypothetical protein
MERKSAQKNMWVALVLLLFLLGIFWISCSGGGGGGTSSGPANSSRLVRWEAPTQFADGGALDPSKDLSSYEIYINETGNFLPNDEPRAVSLAVDASSGNPITSFDLKKVSPPLELGKTYFVAMRAVETNGGKSVQTLPAKFIY